MGTEARGGPRNPASPHLQKVSGGRMTVVGTGDTGGAYVLRIEVAQSLRVRFGRFDGGRLIGVPQGGYVYVGSAMGSDGALGRRLARHASRGAGRPHGIRQAVTEVFGAGCLPGGEKRLRWHIDFLLERRAVDVTHIVAVRDAERLEGAIAEMLMADPDTEAVAPGLGASDARGHTHVLRVPEDMPWWHDLETKIAFLTNRKSQASSPQIQLSP